MKVNQYVLRKELTNVLKDLGVPYKSIKVSRDSELDAIIGINWDADGNILLRYQDMIQDYPMNEVRSVMKHEVCHYFTLLTSKLVAIRPDRAELVKYVLVYREYIAHKEFLQRFGRDENLTSFHKRHFKVYELLVEEAKEICLHRRDEEYLEVINAVFAIMYGATYFYVMGDDSFKKWCEENSLSSLHRFLGWVAEDFEYFAKSEHSSLEIDRLLQLAVVFPLSIDAGSLFVDDRIVMIRKIFDSHHPDVADLAPKWEKRVEEYGTIAE